mmetsp:Transcript_28144/g.57652  ORF Transcript_28144/g.57652 Transcript_28144/m.57652 type:complete len:92 (+) Transcript_28144:1141-1416(+)
MAAGHPEKYPSNLQLVLVQLVVADLRYHSLVVEEGKRARRSRSRLALPAVGAAVIAEVAGAGPGWKVQIFDSEQNRVEGKTCFQGQFCSPG